MHILGFFCHFYLTVNFFIALNKPYCPLRFFNCIGIFYLELMISLAVFSAIFCFYSDVHANFAYLEVDGSTISHMSNAWYKELNPYSFHYWDSWSLHSMNVERVVVEDVWPLTYWIPWEPLIPPIAELCWVYSWIDLFVRSATSGSVFLGQFM